MPLDGFDALLEEFLNAFLSHGHLWVLLVAALLLCATAASDFKHYRIPNQHVLFLLALFPIWALLTPQPPSVLMHCAVGAVALIFGMGLYALRLLGGGDVKLLAALALWAGLPHILSLLAITAIAGGVVALVYGISHIIKKRASQKAALAGDLAAGLAAGKALGNASAPGVIPYGLAIAAGGFAVLWAWAQPSLPAPLSMGS